MEDAANDVREYFISIHSSLDQSTLTVRRFFPVLFGRNLYFNNEGFLGFLEAIGTTFPMELPELDLYGQSRSIYDLPEHVNKNENFRRARAFWLYLARVVYPEMTANPNPIPLHYYNIFGLALGFPLLHAKIVVMAQDIAEVNSSGFAFNGSPCPSLKKFLEFLLVEMGQLKDQIEANNQDLFEVNEDVLQLFETGTTNDASLRNWIDNHVLLVNARLTLENNQNNLAVVWDHSTRFLLNYINDKSPHPVCFIFVGGELANMNTNFVIQARHNILAVNHPTHYLGNDRRNDVGGELDYSTVKPFTTSALFRFRSTAAVGEGGIRDYGASEVMDWMNIFDRGDKERIQDRRDRRKAILRGLYLDKVRATPLRLLLNKVKEIEQNAGEEDEIAQNFRNIVEHFPVLFVDILNDDTTSGESLLAAISTSFPAADLIAEDRQMIEERVNEVIDCLSLDHTYGYDYDNALKFWLYFYLVVHPGLERSNYYRNGRNDNIFKFALGFPLLQAKIVIMAQDPAEVNSSGFAFHGSPCPSHKKFLEFLLIEMGKLKDQVEETDKNLFEVPDEVLGLYNTGTPQKASLQNWSDNRVLLVNAFLTLGKDGNGNYKAADFWEHFTKFLLKYISGNSPHRVCFVFLGKVSAEIGRDVVDQDRHELLAVNHPSHYLRNGGRDDVGGKFDYSTVKPFTTSALFRFRTTAEVGEGGIRDYEKSEVMDWMNIFDRGNEEEIEERRKRREVILRDMYLKRVPADPLKKLLKKVKEIAKEQKGDLANNFREIINHFGILFDEMVSKDNPSGDSFLAAIATSFPAVDSITESEKAEMFRNLSLSGTDKNECDKALNFWMYIYKIVFPGLRDPNKNSKSYKIFEFASEFPLLEAKIVIIGEEPPKDCSSGFAFHGSPNTKIWDLLNLLRKDIFKLVQKSTLNISKLKWVWVNNKIPDQYDEKRYRRDASLQNWIDDRVLMVNARLTLGKGDQPQADFWDHFTKFLLEYISKNSPHKVSFIFTGEVGANIGKNVDFDKKHQVLYLNDPEEEAFIKSAVFRFKDTSTISKEGEVDYSTSEVMDWLKIFDQGTQNKIIRTRDVREEILRELYKEEVQREKLKSAENAKKSKE